MTRLDRTLLLRWIRARVVLMLRNPRVTFFTFVFPLMFLVIFSAINGDVMVPGASGGEVRFAQFYAPSIGIFGLTLACYTNVIFGLATARDERLLKRVRGTPLPMPIYLGSWLTGAMLLGIASVMLMIVVAVPAFGVDIYPRDAARRRRHARARRRLAGRARARRLDARAQRRPGRPGGAAHAAAADASSPASGGRSTARRTGSRAIAHAFPLYHLVQAFDACFVPQTTGSGLRLGPPGRDRGVGRGRACSSPSGASRRSRTWASTSGCGLGCRARSRRGGATAGRAPRPACAL